MYLYGGNIGPLTEGEITAKCVGNLPYAIAEQELPVKNIKFLFSCYFVIH